MTEERQVKVRGEVSVNLFWIAVAMVLSAYILGEAFVRAAEILARTILA